MLKIGLIGCGFMGSMHANCYQNINGACVTAVADLRPQKAEELARLSGAQIYSTGKDLIKKADVDAIDICLPTYLHAEHALLAMKKVKYVFIEKPVALTVEEGATLIEAARACDANIQIGQVIRFWDEYVALAEIVKKGTYGRVINANFRRLSPIPTWGWENWLLDATRSGGAGQDLHIHDIDYVLSIFGKPQSFYSVKNTLGNTNDYVNTIMQYPDFVVGVEGTWGLPESYPFTATFRVVFENSVLENAGGKLLCYDQNGVHEIKIEKKTLDGDGYQGGNISDLGGYYNELLYFCNQASVGAPIEKARLSDAVESLDFVLKELSFQKN
ncbi:MAG: Gfo/Idh/MocA family oxidoreductase [Clostridia bacterium]|nr:Gfo/Idh/MocA family oxidoreductase [Clostridia bacterium]